MLKSILDIRENIAQLNDRILQLVMQQYDKRVRKQIESKIGELTAIFHQLAEAINEVKLGNLAKIILDLLTEIETILVSVTESVKHPAAVAIAQAAIDIISILKKQIAAVDLERQKYIVFQ